MVDIIKNLFRRYEHSVESAATTSSSPRQYYYLGRGRALTSLYTGYPFIVDTNDVAISTWIIRDGRWEASIEQVIMEYCQPGGVFVDCGAHMGYYTILCGRRVGPSGRVFSFEPNPRLFSILRDNIHINGLDNRCLPFNYALASASGSSKMWFEENYSGGGYLSKNPDVDRSADNFKSCQVTLRRLDQILPPDLQVDLMKVDVEGFEPEVFAGGWSIIERSPAIKLVVEMTPDAWRGNGVDPMDFLQRFLVYGFGFSMITEEGQVRVRGPEELIEQTSAVPYISYFIATR